MLREAGAYENVVLGNIYERVNDVLNVSRSHVVGFPTPYIAESCPVLTVGGLSKGESGAGHCVLRHGNVVDPYHVVGGVGFAPLIADELHGGT